jgi:peptidoglycan/xylan/chitin deacetylase (PgdA/CDA1 family)
MKTKIVAFLLAFFLIAACQQKKDDSTTVDKPIKKPQVSTKTADVPKIMADAATILARKEVPILCYHNLKDFTDQAGEMTKTYSVKPLNFTAQMKAIHDAGYHTILPHQLYNYLAYGDKLPSKPIMITFDDTRGEQFSIGAMAMEKYNFKGVFFVMTVAINRPNYLSADEIKKLADAGHEVAAHTWDHHMVTKYTAEDWDLQLQKPKEKLEKIIGKPVTSFAYPFGLWNSAALPEVEKSGYKMAYILSTKRDTIAPIYTIRRMIVSGNWKTEQLLKSIESTFNK